MASRKDRTVTSEQCETKSTHVHENKKIRAGNARLLLALECLEAWEALQLGQLHRRWSLLILGAFASMVAMQTTGQRHLPLQLAEALAALDHAAALPADLRTGQAVGEVRDLRLAALWGGRAAAAGVIIRRSRCGGNSADDDGDGKESGELRWVHGGIVWDSLSLAWADECSAHHAGPASFHIDGAVWTVAAAGNVHDHVVAVDAVYYHTLI